MDWPFDEKHISMSEFWIALCSLGADTRVRVSFQEEELELRLPFGSHSRLFLSEVNRAWSGTLNTDAVLYRREETISVIIGHCDE